MKVPESIREPLHKHLGQGLFDLHARQPRSPGTDIVFLGFLLGRSRVNFLDHNYHTPER